MTLVVIVDDQPINLKILGRYAQSIGTDVGVETFQQAEAALRALDRLSPDLIVTDFVMPSMDGEAFIRHCRSRDITRDTPIIVVTAYEDRDYRYRALDAGASDFLLSPVDGYEFRTRARNLLSLWQHQQALRQRTLALEHELVAAERQLAQEIRRRERHLRAVIDAVPALIRATTRDGDVLLLNTAHAEYFDLPETLGETAPLCDVLSGDYGQRHARLDQLVLQSGRALTDLEERLSDRRRRSRVLLTSKVPLPGETETLEQIVTVSLDITDRKEVERAVQESEQRFRSLVEGSVLGIVIEQDGRPVFANQTFARIFGFATPDEILALPSIDELFLPSERDRLVYLRSEPSTETLTVEPCEYQCRHRDGRVIAIEMVSQEVFWNGRAARQSTVADITLRKAYEERLHRQANFDEVTGLPNRVLALDRLRSAVVTADRHQHKGGVLFIDLDHFKKINDTWGHAVGDQLLRAAADRLRRCVRKEDTVARLGGDEFTIILPNLASPSHTEPVVHKILQAFSRPFVIDRHEAFVTASIGVTVFPDDGEDPAQLMQNADAAMYRAKQRGRHTFEYFTAELNARAMQRMRIESHLVHALDREEFSVCYQPIVDARTGELHAAEALLRWHNPDLGALLPDAFIPLAEDTGLIVTLGAWVLDTACRQLALWRRQGLPRLAISVNLSARQFRDAGLVDVVARALDRNQLPPHALELEITEGCLMQDSDEPIAVLRALHDLGVSLALDDFGTGYSCLSYLKDLPVNTVKIDKSFVLNVYADARNATVVEAIIAMAHRLGIRVIAEGVETVQQLEFVSSRGCDLAQGYHFSRPVSSGEFLRQWVDLRQASQGTR